MPSGIASGEMEGARAPQRKRGHDRVALLLAAAAALFVERGYDATTMTEIAARAGGSIGSLYLFFPTKQGLAQALLGRLGEMLSERLEALRERLSGAAAAAMADGVFDTLAGFLAEHPVYAALIDLPGDEGWRRVLRARRRVQIAALFSEARPELPAGQAERLAVIVPQLMRMAMTLEGEPGGLGAAVREELRVMLRGHLGG